MMYSYTEKKRIRKSFGKTSDVIEAPNLIDLQNEVWFVFRFVDILILAGRHGLEE